MWFFRAEKSGLSAGSSPQHLFISETTSLQLWSSLYRSSTKGLNGVFCPFFTCSMISETKEYYFAYKRKELIFFETEFKRAKAEDMENTSIDREMWVIKIVSKSTLKLPFFLRFWGKFENAWSSCRYFDW